MKLIIDIPDKVYNEYRDGVMSMENNCIIGNAVFDGMPLPKGHGRLVDENHVIAELVYRKNLLADDVTCGQVTEIFNSAVVVDADKENNDETGN